ncbi:ycf20-like protein isoform X3 [Aristolochia californica]|uniref:ycf20-like protein isoform X3 n=1 Tax=Aristolochia californica TaxID=171875 RepID=UPI0035D89409
MRSFVMQPALSLLESENYDRLHSALTICAMQRWNHRPCPTRRIWKFNLNAAPIIRWSYQIRRASSSMSFALDMEGAPGNGNQENLSDADDAGLGGTRLGRIVRAAGQTGDWDVLVAGVVVAAIEGIGMLVYKKPKSVVSNSGRLQSLVVMINFWKAGVCLGLFVDAFKLGS